MSRFMKPEGYYTVAEAAEIVGLKTSGLCYYINEGILQVDIVYYGQKPIRLISREALDAFRRRREPAQDQDHLYEIICISCGVTDVLFSTRSLRELSNMYTRMVENDHKLVRIRQDGKPLLIFESDKLGYAYHPRIKKGIRYGKGMERSEGSPEGDLPGHEQGRVQHGQESGVLRRGAHGPGKEDLLRDRAEAGKPEEPMPAVPAGGQGSVQSDPEPTGREERPGVPARPGPKRRFTDEERRLRRAESSRRWRAAHPEKSRELSRRNHQANREREREQARQWAKTHREKRNAYMKDYMKRRREAARNDPGTKGG